MRAEKLETLYRRDLLNSRSKDFYDLYILFTLKRQDIDDDNLKKACQATFNYRGTEYSPTSLLATIDKIHRDSVMRNRWNVYVKKNSFANGIEVDVVMNTIYQLASLL